MTPDLACSLIVSVALAAVAVAYVARVVRIGPAHHARVEQEGESAILPKSAMEMLLWGASPMVDFLVRFRISPDAITFGSLVFGGAAGVSLALGHFGVGALLAMVSASGDALDGLVARRLGVGSSAGEVLDASVDRYVDFALVAGLAVYFRERTAPLVLALMALQAAFMVSYTTAKAEALHVAAPRGSMRRVERAVLVVGSSLITPWVQRASDAWRDVPSLLALAIIAAVGNTSVIRRISCIRSTVRERHAIVR